MDDDNPWSESYDVISNFVKIDDSVLDIDYGTGTLASELIHNCKEIYPLDISVEMLTIAKEKTSNVNWIHACASSFSFDKEFDFIFLSFRHNNSSKSLYLRQINIFYEHLKYWLPIVKIYILEK